MPKNKERTKMIKDQNQFSKGKKGNDRRDAIKGVREVAKSTGGAILDPEARNFTTEFNNGVYQGFVELKGKGVNIPDELRNNIKIMVNKVAASGHSPNDIMIGLSHIHDDLTRQYHGILMNMSIKRANTEE